MNTSTYKYEKPLALGLCVFLFITVGTISYIIWQQGLLLWIHRLPEAGWGTVLSTNTIVLFVIGWTDFPELIRKSIHLRRQVKCWTFWQFLLALLVMTALGQIPLLAIFYVGAGAFAVLLYSGGAAYRALIQD